MKNFSPISLALGIAITAVGFSSAIYAEEIKVWAWDPNFNVAAMNEAAERYQSVDSSFNLTVIDSGKEDIEQKLHTMLASGVTKHLPDIVLIEDYNAQKYIQAYPGSFLPLQDYIDYQQFAPYKVEVMKVNNDVYGIPFDSGVAGLFYRSDYLEQAGFTHDDMLNITWKRFIDIGKQVKEKTGKYMLTLDTDDVVLPHIMMQSGGEWFLDEEGELNLANNKALIETLETIKAISEADIARPTSGWSELIGGFNSGDVATVTSGVWIMGSIKNVPDQAGKWRVAPIPKLKVEGAKHASNQGGSSWYVLSTTKNRELVIDFLSKTFASDVNMYQSLLIDRGAMATYLPAGKGEAYQTADPFFGGQQVFADFSLWVNEIPQVSYGMYTQEIDDAISASIPAILKGAPVKDVLTQVEQNLKFLLIQ
ncbi:ABC transporter substrate-binding protein [Vibrio sp. qd031]|uniref:ABC transporter substrate-binding protein n=1 Tax=Vibrio sp. qd031 TaxID=1603038 RepID=UPI000A118690|nr:extracellular solute-binding protein [Vibrio sp. qd031]ORT52865.1 ABC transporter substrate-binding protein [Vibrio sp. qd031]